MRRTCKQMVTAYSILLLPMMIRIALADTTNSLSTTDDSNSLTAIAEPKFREGVNYYFNSLLNSTDQPAWLTRTDIFYDIQKKNTPVAGFETIQPLYECGRCTLFGQGRAGYSSGATVFNAGLGHRYLTPDKNFMLGINAFYDEIFRYPHKRLGLGGEFFTPFITLRANYYDAITGQRYVGDNTYQRASSGFDGSIETPVPYISWMRFTLKGYHWKGNRAANVNGGLVNLRVYPGRQLEIAVGYANDNSQHSQPFVNFNYYFGSPDFVQYSASTPHPSPLFAAQDLEKIRLEKALRTNQIVFEKTQTGSSSAVIVARTD